MDSVLSLTHPLTWYSKFDSTKPRMLLQQSSSNPPLRIRCSSSISDTPYTTIEKLGNDSTMTGGAYDFDRATTSLTRKLMSSPKKVTLVRHGLSSWNEESRVQGSSNLSVLTETGVKQAERCRMALSNISYDQCFSSPISRAKSTAEVIWEGRDEPLVFLDSLKEAHLFFLEGMKNGLRLELLLCNVWLGLSDSISVQNTLFNVEAVDAKLIYPKEYTTWREDPCNFSVTGVYPIRKLWETATEAWKEILFTPGENFLVVSHKSMLRALICTALGLGPERYVRVLSASLDTVVFRITSFRAVDINNGGISVFNFNKSGEAMLQSLNMTAHMHSDHTYLF
ncbi:Histidine phosphatase superfamily, clade-1 [Dillenia turbinata]|uniref:Histidine phosphatase superfamily, clade-1 n=1 Tax=Dillenia turbinata TaxID=194707 RepID=A0AAN8VSK4_9MAGN